MRDNSFVLFSKEYQNAAFTSRVLEDITSDSKEVRNIETNEKEEMRDGFESYGCVSYCYFHYMNIFNRFYIF